MNSHLNRLAGFFRNWAGENQRFPVRRFLVALAIALLTVNGLALALILDKSERAAPLQGLPPTTESGKQPGAENASGESLLPTSGLDVPRETPTDPRFAFLLLGYGGAEHEGGYLTDSIVVAIANPDAKTLTLLSIPRDCWVPLLFDGKTAIYNKANTAYALAKDQTLYPNRLPIYTKEQGAGRFASDTISRVLGVPISNYLALDFAGFRQMIDAVGGIDVDVPNSFSARYPANDDSSIDPSWITVRFTKGLEHMSGERAIRFARAREVLDNSTEGGDFARSRRQRLIMEAFKNKLFAPGSLLRLPQILSIASQHVDTNYAFPDIAQFSQFILSWKEVRIYQTALTVDNYLSEATGPGGAYILVPDAPNASWGQVRAFVRRLWLEPAVGVAMANTRVTVVNRTGEPGAATRLSETLASLGYQVGIPETGETSNESRLVYRTAGQGELLADQLEKDLGNPSLEVVQIEDGSSSELVLELGQDDVRLADLKVETGEAAPSSNQGIQRLGVWLPATPTPTPTPEVETVTPTPFPALSPGAVSGETPTPNQKTATPTSTRTNTPVATPTRTSTPTATRTPTRIATPTRTPTRTSLGTGTPTPTRTASTTRASAPTSTVLLTQAPAATRTLGPGST